MKIKFACADFTFPLLTHDQALSVISALDIRGVDIGLFQNRSHLQPATEFRNVRRAARRLKRRLDDNGLVAADIFLQLALDYESRALNHPAPRRRRLAREAFERALDYTSECAARHLTTLPGVRFAGESRRDSLDRAADELAWRVEQACKYRICFAIEPHVGSFADSPKRALQLVQRVPGLTLTLDYGHHYPRGYSEADLETLIPHSSHHHVRGFNRRSGATPLAQNRVDFKRMLRGMKKAGYRGWIELEYGDNNITDTVELRDHLHRLASSL